MGIEDATGSLKSEIALCEVMHYDEMSMKIREYDKLTQYHL